MGVMRWSERRRGLRRHAGPREWGSASPFWGLIIGVLWMNACPGEAATLKVPEEYFTIQEALDAASPGDRVEVANGTYRQALTLRPGVTLESAGGRDSCRLIPPPDTFAMVMAESLSAKAVIRGFALDGRHEARMGVRAVASEVDVMDNLIEGVNTGISLVSCPQGLVARNEILRARAAAVLIQDSSPLLVGNVIRYSSDYSIAIFGEESHPVIGGSRGRANHIVSYKGSVDVGNASPNTIDARYNDWGMGTAVEMNTKGYPADIETIQDHHDQRGNGLVDYRHWEGQPLIDSLLSEPERLVLPGILAAAVIIGLVVSLARHRRARVA